MMLLRILIAALPLLGLDQMETCLPACLHACQVAVAICLSAIASLLIASRKWRFIVLTTTLQGALVPFYIGIYLAMLSPIVTFGTLLALGTLLACIRAVLHSVEVRYTSQKPRSRLSQALQGDSKGFICFSLPGAVF